MSLFQKVISAGITGAALVGVAGKVVWHHRDEMKQAAEVVFNASTKAASEIVTGYQNIREQQKQLQG